MSDPTLCTNCGERPYPPRPDGICDACRSATPEERTWRAGQKGRNLEADAKGEELRVLNERRQALQLEHWDGWFRDQRPRGPCARCGHPQLIRCKMQELATTGSDYVHTYATPMGATFIEQPKATMMGLEVSGSGGFVPVGFMVTYICQACGFTEWWVAKPEEIPIGVQYGTEIVDATDDGPYR